MKKSLIVSLFAVTLFGHLMLYLKNKNIKIAESPIIHPEGVVESSEKLKPPPREVLNYAEALISAKESGCNIFLYFGAPWCGPCEQMKRNTLSDKEVKDKLSKNFVILKINIDNDEKLANKFEIDVIPTYMILDVNEKILRKNSGFEPKNKFLLWLDSK